MKLQMYMKGDDLSLNWRSSDLCLHVMHSHPLSFYVHGHVSNIYIYIAMLTFWLSNAWHPSFIYRYSNSYSWLNYYCTELLSDTDSDIIFIHLLVPKIILHTCYISNEWTLWWINFLDCATLHGCTVYIYCL